MLENKLDSIDTSLSDLVHTIEALDQTGPNGQTVADSLEGIEYWLQRLTEAIEKIESKM